MNSVVPTEWAELSEHEIKDQKMPLSTQFEFDYYQENIIYVIDEANIWMYNYKTGDKDKLVSFKQHMIRQPDHFVMNEDQTICFVSCSTVDSIFINLSTTKEIDFDMQFEATEIKAAINANGHFYIVANRIAGRYGVYVIQLN